MTNRTTHAPDAPPHLQVSTHVARPTAQPLIQNHLLEPTAEDKKATAMTGWWLTYPIYGWLFPSGMIIPNIWENMKVNWDDDYSQYFWKNKSYDPKHQPDDHQ